MTVFSCKAAFDSLGLERIRPSHAHASQECPICLDPLAVHPIHNTDPSSILHAAIRILACGHVVGVECLETWLSVGNTCPTCNRILFQAASEPITQQDVNNILHALSPMFGEDRVMGEVARLMVWQAEENARLRQIHEVEMAKLRATESQVRDEEFKMSSDDFLDSDEDVDFGEGDYMDLELEEGEDTSDCVE
ncbi:uncharacterized protein K460DRAFT_405722 [Cucurbitaria berberidis CBS 394.84]|uniref:RING-type domain-containing protein n=1 Tax=Cucurbitaria berberidis CBS 394.84 TaxID=1168544 RepID=A0A9P4GG58_9PLEO|nr:uncharacterized protein K460DRAFT_405722 [Cucurbitaria berberidis CBS 394.84]KAF1845463.1 hypothetical protein K460DRAFT_405722 [Cucurbitaria berberidis CBS 394.84]